MEELDKIDVNEETVVTYGDILNVVEGTKHMSNWLFENMGKLSQEQVRSLFAPLATTFTCAVRMLPPKVSKKIYKEMSDILGVNIEQIARNPGRFADQK